MKNGVRLELFVKGLPGGAEPCTNNSSLTPFLILIALALVSASSLGQSARTVQIQRTAFGVAHIEAADFEALAYGVAYAHAQDNVCHTADHLLTIRGERSKFLGGTAQGLLGLRPLPNDQIDAFIGLHMNDEALTAAN